MSASDKLQNIKAIKQLLAGEHRTQTRKNYYYGDADVNREKAQTRKVGDRWVEESANGNKTYYEQKQGFRVKSSVSWEQQEVDQKLREELRTFRNCPKDKCTCIQPTSIDSKFRTIHGMCLECVTAQETSMQIRGEFNDYAKRKMFENVKAYIREMESEFEYWKRDVQGKMSFANGDGTIEQWESTDSAAMVKRMEDELSEMKSALMKRYDPDYIPEESNE